MLRNQNTRCNGLMPLQGPEVSEEEYGSGVESWWNQLEAIGHAPGGRFRLLCHDIKFLLLRYSFRVSFSVHSKGGGRESNFRMLPFMIQMGLFLLDGQREGGSFPSSSRPTYEKLLSQFLLQRDDASSSAVVTEPDEVYYMLALSLFVLSQQQWKLALPRLLRASLLQALGSPIPTQGKGDPKQQKTDGEKNGEEKEKVLDNSGEGKGKEKESMETDKESPDEKEKEKEDEGTEADANSLFGRCRATLIYLALLNALQGVLKKEKGGAPTTTLVISSLPTDEWIEAMRKLLQSSEDSFMKACHGVLETYQDLFLNYADFSEFFDDLGKLRNPGVPFNL